MSVADQLNELREKSVFMSEYLRGSYHANPVRGGFLLAEIAAVLPEIAAVIAAAEETATAYTAEAEDWNDGEFALWSKDDLVTAIVEQRDALTALAARLIPPAGDNQ